MAHRNTVLFGFMCLIWGLTWVAVKAGLASVPPLFFAGTRFVAAGAVIFGYLLLAGQPVRFARSDAPRLAAVSLLLIGLTYGLLFWGMQFISSGTAAMLELSFTPVALLIFALLFRQERFDPVRASAIVLGVVGLAILFGPKMAAGSSVWEILGASATVVAAVVYGWGSVLARPLIAARGPWSVAAASMLVGGLVLVVASLCIEPAAWSALRGDWGVGAWAGWLFLLGFGSLCGFTIYLSLLSRWGASKAGSYAFVSPVIAVWAGTVVYGEHVTGSDAIGMAVMLAAAAVAVRTEPRLPMQAEAPVSAMLTRPRRA